MGRRRRAARLSGAAWAIALLACAPAAIAAPCPDPEAVTVSATDRPVVGSALEVRIEVSPGVIGPVTGSVTVADDEAGAQPFGPLAAGQSATLTFSTPAAVGTQFGIRAAWSIAGGDYGALTCDGASSVAATVAPPPAQQPRVDGVWRATTTPVGPGKSGGPQRDTGRAVPICRAGACDFRFLGRRWRLRNDRYTFAFSAVANCLGPRGRIVARRAYTARVTVAVRVAARARIGDAMHATRLTGQGTTLYVANARGRAAGCRARYALVDRLDLRRLRD